MSTTLKFRRGTTSELGALTGSEAELFVDTTKTTVVVMDGTTLGGTPLAKSSDVPTAVSDLTNDLGFLTSGDIPTAVSELTNDSGFITSSALANVLETSDIGVTVQGYDSNLNGWSLLAPPTGDIVGTTDYQILENKTLTNYVEQVYALPTNGTIALDPSNGAIQTCALSALTSFTVSGISSGQSILLMITNGDQYTVTWPTMTWVTSSGNIAPTLTAADTLVIWKVGTVVYGAIVGSYA